MFACEHARVSILDCYSCICIGPTLDVHGPWSDDSVAYVYILNCDAFRPRCVGVSLLVNKCVSSCATFQTSRIDLGFNKMNLVSMYCLNH